MSKPTNHDGSPRLQCKHMEAEQVLWVIDKLSKFGPQHFNFRQRHPRHTPNGTYPAHLNDLQFLYRSVGFHPKVVQRKMAKLIRQKKITGCACGCRGDFHVRSE